MAERETHEEVVRLARRELEDHERINCWFRPEFVRALIDRLEAAHKREAAFHAMTCEANDRLREHLQIALDANKRERGDAAKLREALEFIKQYFDKIDPFNINTYTFSQIEVEHINEAIDAALSAPSRNCDLARDWMRDLYAHFQPPASVKREMPPEWVDAVMAFCRWLVAPATEQEGGNK